ncbi:MAG: rhamnulokinase [Lentisphaerae bacterium]|nr:rhamnulokinase [Lentisphaerota bacterium]
MTPIRLFAIDLGASGGKCFAATLDGQSFAMQEVHRFAHEGVSFYQADRTGRETERTCWDDVLLYQNILTGLRTYRRDVADRLDAIGVDTWGADGQLLSPDGDVLGRMFCYRDHRLDGMIERVKQRVDPRRLYGITGIHFQPFNLSNQLLWLVENRPDLLRPGCRFLPVPAVFHYYLCGNPAVDASWASVSQLMDAKRRVWSDELLDALGIPADLLPPIVPPGTRLGELRAPLAAAVGLNRAMVVAAAAHDTACAFAAAPVQNPDEALIISSGTWSLVGKLVPAPITNEAAMQVNISNEGGVGNIRLLKNCMGTWIVQELRRAWAVADGREKPWDELTAQATHAPAFTALIDPDDAGFYNPANMETAIADYCRRTRQAPPATRGAFLRTVYESLALKYRRVNEQVCAVSNTHSRVVHIVGGGSRNALLNQFTADALGLPVLAGPEEATAVGNFMVQALGLGALRQLAEAQPIIRAAFPIKRFEPQAQREGWERAYARLTALCG